MAEKENKDGKAAKPEKAAKGHYTVLTTRIVWFLLGVFLLTAVISQMYIYFRNDLNTVVALRYDATDSITFKGVFIRNEKLVTYTGAGVVTYMNSDGSKLAKNSVVAEIYSTQSDVLIQKQIDAKQEQIDVLTDAQSLIGTDNSQLEAFTNQINEKHSQLLLDIEEGNYESAEEQKSSYLNLQSKKQIVSGTQTDYSDKIAQLESDIAALRARISSQPVDLHVGETGYFVSVVDGYEAKLTRDNVDSITKEDIEGIIAQPTLNVDSSAIGKIIDSYTWDLAAILNTDEAYAIMGGTVKMRVGSSPNIVTATIKSIEKYDDGTSKYIFECDRLTTEFVESRVAQFKLILGDYSGIRIPTDAIRFDEEGNKGVYIKSGIEIKFRKIKQILTEDDFILAEDTSGQAGMLALYDTIVVGGKDLYDGKIIE